MATTTETRVVYGAGVARVTSPPRARCTEVRLSTTCRTPSTELYFIRVVALHVREAVLLLDPARRSIVPAIDDFTAALPADCATFTRKGCATRTTGPDAPST
jgi:hypothetical protein